MRGLRSLPQVPALASAGFWGSRCLGVQDLGFRIYKGSGYSLERMDFSSGFWCFQCFKVVLGFSGLLGSLGLVRVFRVWG